MKICVVGVGYVGLSLSVLLSRYYNVVAFDIDIEKINKLNNHISPIEDVDIKNYLKNSKLNLNATNNFESAIKDSNYVIICTPTNYNEDTNYFDTSSIESTIEKIKCINSNAIIIIKSTVPIGYTNYLKNKYKELKIIFSPEFLREGSALYDNLYPSRIIIGDKSKEAVNFGYILKKCSKKSDVSVMYMNSSEAEAVKLFANTYLALRVAFFNELDTFALEKSLNAKDIIDGISSDERIGNYYNNPSFGYGGYCLPKDSKQLYSNYVNIPEKIIEAVVKSNETRKRYIADCIIRENPNVVGIYRLVMKSNSDNFRESSIHDIIKYLKNNNIDVIIFEPTLNESMYLDCPVINDFDKFINEVNIVVANRYDKKIKDIPVKVFSRDIYSIN